MKSDSEPRGKHCDKYVNKLIDNKLFLQQFKQTALLSVISISYQIMSQKSNLIPNIPTIYNQCETFMSFMPLKVKTFVICCHEC